MNKNMDTIDFVIKAIAIRIVEIRKGAPPTFQLYGPLLWPQVVFYLKSASDRHNIDVIVDQAFMDEHSPQIGGYHVRHKGDRHLGGRYFSAEDFKSLYEPLEDFQKRHPPFAPHVS